MKDTASKFPYYVVLPRATNDYTRIQEMYDWLKENYGESYPAEIRWRISAGTDMSSYHPYEYSFRDLDDYFVFCMTFDLSMRN